MHFLMSDCPSSKMLGIAERVRQCKDEMSRITFVFNAVSTTVEFSIKMKPKIFTFKTFLGD